MIGNRKVGGNGHSIAIIRDRRLHLFLLEHDLFECPTSKTQNTGPTCELHTGEAMASLGSCWHPHGCKCTAMQGFASFISAHLDLYHMAKSKCEFIHSRLNRFKYGELNEQRKML